MTGPSNDGRRRKGINDIAATQTVTAVSPLLRRRRVNKSKPVKSQSGKGKERKADGWEFKIPFFSQ